MTMRTVRFKVREGHLEPLEQVPLVEGSEVDVTVQVSRSAGTTVALLELMQRLPEIDPSTVDEFERGIESSKLPVNTAGAFDRAKS